MSSPSADLVAAGRDAQRLERQANARTVLAAYRVGVARFDDILYHPQGLNPRVGDHAQKAAVGEISLQFGVSKTMAGTWFALGGMLDHLPLIRLAYLRGEFSYRRAQLIATTLTGVSTSDLEDAQQQAIALASWPVTDPTLRDQLDELLITLDPGKAATDRDEFTCNQDVRISKDRHGHSSIDGCVPAAQGEHLRTRIRSLITTRLCARDPRTTGQQRVAALADLQGMTTLTCHCGRYDCDRGTSTPPEPTHPVVITITSGPGATPRLRGYAAIDPALADELTEQAQAPRSGHQPRTATAATALVRAPPARSSP